MCAQPLLHNIPLPAGLQCMHPANCAAHHVLQVLERVLPAQNIRQTITLLHVTAPPSANTHHRKKAAHCALQALKNQSAVQRLLGHHPTPCHCQPSSMHAPSKKVLHITHCRPLYKALPATNPPPKPQNTLRQRLPAIFNACTKHRVLHITCCRTAKAPPWARTSLEGIKSRHVSAHTRKSRVTASVLDLAFPVTQ